MGNVLGSPLLIAPLPEPSYKMTSVHIESSVMEYNLSIYSILSVPYDENIGASLDFKLATNSIGQMINFDNMTNSIDAYDIYIGSISPISVSNTLPVGIVIDFELQYHVDSDDEQKKDIITYTVPYSTGNSRIPITSKPIYVHPLFGEGIDPTMLSTYAPIKDKLFSNEKTMIDDNGVNKSVIEVNSATYKILLSYQHLLPKYLDDGKVTYNFDIKTLDDNESSSNTKLQKNPIRQVTIDKVTYDAFKRKIKANTLNLISPLDTSSSTVIANNTKTTKMLDDTKMASIYTLMTKLNQTETKTGVNYTLASDITLAISVYKIRKSSIPSTTYSKMRVTSPFNIEPNGNSSGFTKHPMSSSQLLPQSLDPLKFHITTVNNNTSQVTSNPIIPEDIRKNRIQSNIRKLVDCNDNVLPPAPISSSVRNNTMDTDSLVTVEIEDELSKTNKTGFQDIDNAIVQNLQ